MRRGPPWRESRQEPGNPPKQRKSLVLSYIIKERHMNCGRPTTNPKGESIRVRITEEMKIKLNKQSSQTGKSVSQIIRDLISGL
nr:MAG TPA: hypothetical protein [Caudoviricetes sp.]